MTLYNYQAKKVSPRIAGDGALKKLLLRHNQARVIERFRELSRGPTKAFETHAENAEAIFVSIVERNSSLELKRMEGAQKEKSLPHCWKRTVLW